MFVFFPVKGRFSFKTFAFLERIQRGLHVLQQSSSQTIVLRKGMERCQTSRCRRPLTLQVA